MAASGKKQRKGLLTNVVFYIVWVVFSFCFKIFLICLYIITKLVEIALIHINKLLETVIKGKS